MTLRLTDEQDARLTRLAEKLGVSKNEAAARAIDEIAGREDRGDEIRRLTREIITQDGPLLDHLAE